MKYTFYKLCMVASLGVLLIACSPTPKDTPQTDIESGQTTATDTPADYKAIDLANFDTTVRPQDNFYLYVNGTWLKNNPVPASETRWTSFNEVLERNRKILREVVQEALQASAEPNSPQGQVAAFYESGMNEAKRNELGKAPIEGYLKAIEEAKNKEDLLKVVAEQKPFASSFFVQYATADEKNSDTMALYLYQGGMSLPTKVYYEAPDFEEKRKAFVNHVKNMFMLLGEDEDKAATKANNVMTIEMALAKVSRTPAQRRDSEKNYNKMTIEELQKRSPAINWKSFFDMLNIPATNEVILGEPEFFEGLSKIINQNTLETLKDYQTYQLASSLAPYLSQEFVEEDFDFYNKTLRGQNEQQENWKLVLNTIDRNIGHSLGQLYVAKAFSPKAKERAKIMIEDVRKAFEDHIKALAWMGTETKQQALKKLSMITTKIGYPDTWKTYDGLVLSKENYVQNVINARKWATKDNLMKVGKPVDKSEWFMTPSTVNAYYSPTKNEIVFPAGILQPPFFSEYADDAVNYGGIGAVIGHEISHGFDDQGSQYDAEGNMKNWWTEEDRNKFKMLTKSLEEQYNAYTVLDGVHLKGDATLGENIADLGGVAVAYDALQKAWARDGKPEPKDGLTPEQRFFVSWAQIWRVNFTDDELRNRIETDSHSPGMFRANGPLSNFPPFFTAFDVKEGDEMRRDSLITIW